MEAHPPLCFNVPSLTPVWDAGPQALVELLCMKSTLWTGASAPLPNPWLFLLDFSLNTGLTMASDPSFPFGSLWIWCNEQTLSEWKKAEMGSTLLDRCAERKLRPFSEFPTDLSWYVGLASCQALFLLEELRSESDPNTGMHYCFLIPLAWGINRSHCGKFWFYGISTLTFNSPGKWNQQKVPAPHRRNPCCPRQGAACCNAPPVQMLAQP